MLVLGKRQKVKQLEVNTCCYWQCLLLFQCADFTKLKYLLNIRHSFAPLFPPERWLLWMRVSSTWRRVAVFGPALPASPCHGGAVSRLSFGTKPLMNFLRPCGSDRDQASTTSHTSSCPRPTQVRVLIRRREEDPQRAHADSAGGFGPAEEVFRPRAVRYLCRPESKEGS